MKVILGISAFYHDSAAAVVRGGDILAAAQEERFTRKKHTAGFPIHAIRYCLEETGYDIDQLDAIVFYDKPFLKFERLLQTYYSFAPRGLASFIKAIPVWLGEKLFLKKKIHDGLKEVMPYDKSKLNLLFSEHHLSHAASAFYPSPFEAAAILTIDGVGEWCTASICKGKGREIEMIREMEFPHSVGLLYSAFTYFLGFKVNSGEYKLMGLAPYGNPNALRTKEFIEKIRSTLVQINDDGSIWLDQQYFDYATGLKMTATARWETLFGVSRREKESDIEQVHCDLAFAIQSVTEEIVLKMAREAKRISNASHLCLAGGVALNCVANGKLVREGQFEGIYIQPAAGDAGGALGAALAVDHLYFETDRKLRSDGKDHMAGSLLGPDFSSKEILVTNRKLKAVATQYKDLPLLTAEVARKLAEGNVVGWFQGRMEFGPRALGNRSILADPRNPDMQKKLNLKIKYRESFRPFGPSVLEEDQTDYFDLTCPSPYMLLTAPIVKERQMALPDDYFSLPLAERLQVPRSDIQSVTHVDFSARIQAVNEDTNKRYWSLIQAFKKITDYGVLINTSFNIRGEPIVCTPFDAYRCFMCTEMDYLVIGDYVYAKKDQPDWVEK